MTQTQNYRRTTRHKQNSELKYTNTNIDKTENPILRHSLIYITALKNHKDKTIQNTIHTNN